MKFIFKLLILGVILFVGYSIFLKQSYNNPVSFMEGAELRANIIEHPSLWFKNLDIEIKGDTITLNGKLKNQKQLDELLKLAQSDPAITNVVNNITLENSSTEEETPNSDISNEKPLLLGDNNSNENVIIANALKKLKNHPATKNLSFELSFKDGVLTVKGEVPNKLTLIEVESILLSVDGVVTVNKELKIS